MGACSFPEELVKRCILSSTPDAGVCAVCGAPWARVVDVSQHVLSPTGTTGGGRDEGGWSIAGGPRTERISNTLGWRPTCSHQAEARPATILDPFGGSGTSAVVARSLGRRFVGIELSSDYVAMALRRLTSTQPAMAGLW